MSFLVKLFITLTYAASTNAQTALLFGASGAVGSEILRDLIHDNFWEEVVLIGRKFPLKVQDIIAEAGGNDDQHPDRVRVTQISLPDLADVDQNKNLLASETIQKSDACFIAAGVGRPHELSLSDWHSIEVEMVASMARLCNKVEVRYISLLSASEVTEEPEPFSQVELNENRGPLGWFSMIKFYARMKKLEENGVIVASEHIPFIRLFQPSTIVTEDIRYGWVDWTLFYLHKVLDPIMPFHYHSVHVRLLGMAMAKDAVGVLRGGDDSDDITKIMKDRDDLADPRISKVIDLHYEDYMRLAGAEFHVQNEKNHKASGTNKESTEL